MKPYFKTSLRLAGTLLLALSAGLAARADYQSTILSQSPAAYYRLNETQQPLAFTITNLGSLGTSVASTYVSFPPLNQPGPFAGSVAVGLDGASQYITTPWVAGLNTANFTFEIWANPAVVPKFAYLASAVDVNNPRSGWYFAQDDGSTFGLGSAYVVRFFNKNSTTPSITLSAPVLPAGIWEQLTLTYDGTTACLYTNGVLAQSGIPTPYAGLGYVPDDNQPFTVGARSSLNFFWPGSVAETAMYGGALSASRVAAHYAAGTTAPATYQATVLADAPLLYERYNAPANPDPTAVNIGALGSAGNGFYLSDATVGAPGPQVPSEPGFSTTNTAAAFDAGGGSVMLPPFNFNTNALTISGWVNASNAQEIAAGIVVCDSGSTYAGLTIDGVNGGLGLGYVWNNDPSTYNWSPSGDAGLPNLPDSQWAYVALVVQPTEADIYLATADGTFSSVTNYFTHINQSFAGPTLIGTDAGQPTYSFNGAIDEVAIWNRSLSSGDLYTQFGSALGNLAPKIFNDLLSPSQPIVAGDTLQLSANVGGTPGLSYQWYFNSGAITGATNPVFTLPNFSIAANSGPYYLIVTNLYGSVTSAVATVTGQLATAPVILSQPVGGTIYPGGVLNLQVVATGGGLQFQWMHNATNLPGATGPQYYVASVTNATAGTYTLSVTNKLGATNLGPFVIVVPTLQTGTYAQVVDADAPTAWWRLDETGVTNGTILADAMGRESGVYTNNGGLTAGIHGAITGGLAGTAAFFDGDGSYGYVPYFSALSNPQFSLEVWVRQSTATAGTVASSSDGQGNDYGIQAGTYWEGESGDEAFGEGPGGGAAPNNVNYDPTIYPNQWAHIVIEFGGTGNATYPYQIYVNGKTDGYIWGTSGSLNSSQPFIIGGRGSGSSSILSRVFAGSVDEVAFYNKTLTAAQIQNHYAAAFFQLPPTFSVQPVSQDAFRGQNITFSTTVIGAPPISLQWLKNGHVLPGQTNSSITLTNVFYTDSSDVYALLATNLFGSATSHNAAVTVYYPPTYANLTNGLVLHLAFDGNYNDTSGHGNDGTPMGSPSFVPGAIGGQAVNVFTDTTNRSYNYVALGTPTDLLFSSNVDFSVSYWVQIPTNSDFSDPAQTNQYPGDLPFLCSAVGSTYSWGLTLAPAYKTGGWAWSLYDGNGNGAGLQGPSDSLNDGNWHNVVETFTRSGSALTFVDGLQVNSSPLAGVGDVDSGEPFNIGQDPTGTYGESGGFNLDDIGIWRRALTDIEARSIYIVGETYKKSFDTFGPSTLSLNRLANGQLVIAWQSGHLYEAASLKGPWTIVPGASVPSYTVTPTGTNTFFGVGP